MTIENTLTDELEDHFSETEWPKVAPLLRRLERDRAICREFERLRARGASVIDACQKISEKLPYKLSSSMVQQIVYERR